MPRPDPNLPSSEPERSVLLDLVNDYAQSIFNWQKVEVPALFLAYIKPTFLHFVSISSLINFELDEGHLIPSIIMSTVFEIREHKLECQHIREYARATANSQEEVLHLAIKQYIPLDNPNPKEGDVTIIGAHANGFPKVSQHLSVSIVTSDNF